MTALDDRTSSSADEASLGQLVATATRELSTLLRQEVALAKLELKQEAKHAGIGVGAFGAAGFLGLLSVIFLSVALAYALGRVMPLGAGFLVVGALYLVVAGLLGLVGKKQVGKVGPPQRTVATVKGDVEWAKHPTLAPTRRSTS